MGQRVKWLDAAKGLGMILVLLGHAPREIMRVRYPGIDFAYYFIYTFHMHFFFFLSGYAAALSFSRRSEQTFLSYLKGRVRGLLIPWALYSLLVYLAMFLVNEIPVLQRLTEGTFMQGMTFPAYLASCISGSNPYCTHLWYIYTLFMVQILVFACQKIFGRISGRHSSLGFYAVMEAAAVIGYFFLPVQLPVAVSVKGYILYYLLGMIVMTYREKGRGGGFSPLFLAGPLLCAVNVLAVDMGMWQQPLGQNIISCICVFAGAPLTIFLLVYAAEGIAEKSRGLLWLGNHSFAVYLLHQPLCCAILGTLLVLVLPRALIYDLLTMLLCVAMSVIVPMAVVKAGNRLGLGKMVNLLMGGRECES